MEELIGTIKLFAGNFAPHGWLICDGRLLNITQNAALFSIIGTPPLPHESFRVVLLTKK